MSYGQRKSVLTKLGFKDYGEYLQSPLWKELRSEQLRDHPNCILCNQRAIQVHHKSYSTPVMIGADRTQFVSLCILCHTMIEVGTDGKKRNYSLDKAVRTRYSYVCPEE